MTNAFPIPEALRSLGQPIQLHPPRPGAGRSGYFAIAAVFALLSGLTVIGIVNPPEHNPPPPVVLLAIMSVCLFLALVFLGVGWASQTYTLILFPDGLARTGAGAPEIFFWKDVTEVYSYVNPIAPKCRIVARDNRRLEIDAAVKDRKQLGQTVLQTLADRMLPAALESVARGDTVSFGPLRLDRDFLHYKEKQIAWGDIGKMQLLYNAFTRSIQFEVSAAGSVILPWCVVKSQDIPNLNVFKSLAERQKPFQ